MKKLVKPKTKKEFNDLKGLPPEEQPYSKKEIPKRIEEVHAYKKPKQKLNLGDVWNVIIAIFRNEVLKQLNPEQKITALSWRYLFFCFLGLAIILLIIGLFK